MASREECVIRDGFYSLFKRSANELCHWEAKLNYKRKWCTNQPLKSQEPLLDILYPNLWLCHTSSNISDVGLTNFISSGFRSAKWKKATEIQDFSGQDGIQKEKKIGRMRRATQPWNQLNPNTQSPWIRNALNKNVHGHANQKMEANFMPIKIKCLNSVSQFYHNFLVVVMASVQEA